MEKSLNHLIIGPGAVGLGLASLLGKHSTIALLGKPGSLPPSTITLTGQGYERNTKVHSLLGDESLNGIKNIDVIWISTPAYEVANVITRIKPYLNKANLLVIVSNGLGVYHEARSLVTEDVSLARGLIEVGFKRIDEHTDVITGKPKIILAGEDIRKLQSLASELSEKSWISIIESDVQKAEWAKAILNVFVNPVCALAECQNEKVLTELFPVALQAVNEARSVASALGIDLVEISDEYLKSAVEFTRTNICSTLAQLRAKKRLEIDYILGAIIRHAKTKNIAVPTLTLLNSLLKIKEQESIASQSLTI